ncbi:cytochrome c biogenesis CcdA family protein [Streptomyces netropsis]|uniref:Cytochrome c-type biogenesis protein n=1 Tax=Streptomyces netropsis TaxID=55404 RepID=A0A7W7LID0_STRNE|nr:cytochrome c biogenesis protein CcdA [Streptomyces netropsis]MBB4890770.1 cytochrome c-type biogenesis protein [Streptomyces netropsis]GGR51839.1 cytochrome C biogenesis protein CcdA [Streptomyces netropsis]
MSAVAASSFMLMASTESTVTSGTLIAAIPVAALAGLISFFSPCVLPLVPGYLSYVTGLSAADLASVEEKGKRGRMLTGSLLFVLGFSVPFVTQGAFFGFFGRTLLEYQESITIALGFITILLGLAFMGFLPGFAQRDFRIHRKPAAGLLGAPLLGFVFGLGWTPCLGPTLGTVIALSMNEASASRGALLISFFCLGLGLPFILAAIAFRRALGAFGWVKKNYKWVLRAGGGLLIIVGILLVTGVWGDMVAQIREWAPGSETIGF